MNATATAEKKYGYLDPDVAAASGQLASSEAAGRVRWNGREVLAQTTEIVGATWGEAHRNVLIAMSMTYVARGDDGKASTSVARLAKLIYGDSAGGREYRKVTDAILDLFRGEITVSGYDPMTGEQTEGLYSRSRLLIDIKWHDEVEKIREGELTDPAEIARRLGGTRGEDTIYWRFHPEYARRLEDKDVISLDWNCLRELHGVAQSLWIQLSAPRFGFKPIVDRPGWEAAEVLLDEETYRAFGVHASEDRFRRRTLNQAGERIVATDPSYEVFQAEGGRNRPSVLRIVRRIGTGGIVGAVTIEDVDGNAVTSNYWPPRGSELADVEERRNRTAERARRKRAAAA